MTIKFNKLPWQDPKVVVLVFLIFIAALLSDDESLPEYKDLDPHTVVKVIDGDTIELANGEKVRYIGIDTPESVHPQKSVECFALQASKYNKDLVLDKVVKLEKDFSDRDKYGRLLRYVYVDDKFVNLDLVAGGYAYSVSYPPDIKYQNIFENAEQMAMDRGEGLWTACQNNN